MRQKLPQLPPKVGAVRPKSPCPRACPELVEGFAPRIPALTRDCDPQPTTLQSRLAGRQKKAHRFNGGKSCYRTARVPAGTALFREGLSGRGLLTRGRTRR